MAAYVQQPASHAHAANLRSDLDLSTEQLLALLDLGQQEAVAAAVCDRPEGPVPEPAVRKTVAADAPDV